MYFENEGLGVILHTGKVLAPHASSRKLMLTLKILEREPLFGLSLFFFVCISTTFRDCISVSLQPSDYECSK